MTQTIVEQVRKAPMYVAMDNATVTTGKNARVTGANTGIGEESGRYPLCVFPPILDSRRYECVIPS
jgi:hypothetical protein